MIDSTTVGEGRFEYLVDPTWEQLPDRLSHPDVSGVAVDSKDRVYVLHRGENPVMVYEPDGSFVGAWGGNLFVEPHGLRVGSDNSVYVVDDFDHTVRKFTTDGEIIWTLGTPGTPSDTGYVYDDYRSITGVGPPFNRPTNLALSKTGNFYVTDGYGNARVHCFSGDGTLQFSWGEPGIGKAQFCVPHSVAVDARNRILVADRENNRIQVFTAVGEFIEQWDGLARPCDIAINPDGYVFVAELGLYAGAYSFQAPSSDPDSHSRVSILDKDGRLQSRWGTPDSAALGSFYAAHCICLDSAGNVYVGEVNHSAGEGAAAGYHTLQRFVHQVAARPLL